jgi:hypothetical protein
VYPTIDAMIDLINTDSSGLGVHIQVVAAVSMLFDGALQPNNCFKK